MKKNKTIGKKRSVTFHFLYYWTKVTCINPLILSDNDELRYSYFGPTYAILVTVVCSYVWYRIWNSRLETIFPGETPIAVITSLMILVNKYVESIHTWFIFGFRQNRIKRIVKSFINAENTSLKLGITSNYEKSFTKLAIVLIVVTTSYMILIFGNNAFETSNDVPLDNFWWFCFFLPQISTFTVWTTFISIIGIVKTKFQQLNDRVRSLVQYNHSKIITNESSLETKKKSNCSSVNLNEEIKLIAQLHRELRDVVHRTVEHGAACILSDILNQFFCITSSAHIAYRCFKTFTLGSDMNFFYMTGVLAWVFLPIAMMAVISNVCGSTSDEANETRKILHSVLNDMNNFSRIPSAAMFNVLSLDLLQNKLRISVLGFFDLDHHLVFRTITTSVTILTIMLQFYN